MLHFLPFFSSHLLRAPFPTHPISSSPFAVLPLSHLLPSLSFLLLPCFCTHPLRFPSPKLLSPLLLTFTHSAPLSCSSSPFLACCSFLLPFLPPCSFRSSSSLPLGSSFCYPSYLSLASFSPFSILPVSLYFLYAPFGPFPLPCFALPVLPTCSCHPLISLLSFLLPSTPPHLPSVYDTLAFSLHRRAPSPDLRPLSVPCALDCLCLRHYLVLCLCYRCECGV